ncbi:hypothetical protein ES332_D03G121700v1 [Gossypium tomentosum]|uniref:DUF4283 domain-containing protein n=1 Tax=Gossypium tomentosum TaxID=34277 RepID=A0A5D2LME9_GOSTO|nr:hypothetical protein ES332_D03G121700v1 [Gossypium tomentosum]
MNDDIELVAGDVIIEEVDDVSSIQFLDYAHSLVEKNMAQIVIVKLFGRGISYNALWNRILALQKLVQVLHLIDTKNDYFLAKFKSIVDYNKVLMKGPSVIYNLYLMIQP